MLLWLAVARGAVGAAPGTGLVGRGTRSADRCLRRGRVVLVPGFIVFWFAAAYGDAGRQVPLVILGGMVLRMIFVFFGMVIVQSADPRLGLREFVIWLLAFYVVLLGVETFLVVPRSGSANGQPHAGGV